MCVPLLIVCMAALLAMTACQEHSGPTDNKLPVTDSIELDGTVQDLPSSTTIEGFKIYSGTDSTLVAQGGTLGIPTGRTQNKAVLLADQMGELRHAG